MKRLIFFIFYIFIIFPTVVSAYSPTTTHAGLTDQIVEFYNLTHTNDISDAEKEIIIGGAIDEDSPSSRTLNHFYDPIRNIGINGGVTSKRWALDESILTNEYSWQKSIDSYARGDEETALKGLGHILHLIEDASVPEHTRNDPHIGDGVSGAFTNDSPFEVWTDMNKTRSTLRGLASRSFFDGDLAIKKSALDEYFDFLALYSNGNFFSRDTIENVVYQYDKPEIIEYDERYGYGMDSITKDKFKLALKEKIDDVTFKLTLVNKHNDTSVLSSYFDRLSKQAVLAGAGVIELFFREGGVARSEYLKQERLMQEKEERDAEKLSRELSSKGFFGLVWKGMGYLVMDNVVSPTIKIVKDTSQKVSHGALAISQNVSNLARIGGFSVSTATSIVADEAEKFVDETKEKIGGGVAAARTFVQNVLNSSIVSGQDNTASVLNFTGAPTISADELQALSEILEKVREDVFKIENSVRELNNGNGSFVVVVADEQIQSDASVGGNNTEIVSSVYVAGIGGGGGTPTQISPTKNTEKSDDGSDSKDKSADSLVSENDSDNQKSDEQSDGNDSRTSSTESPTIITPSDFSLPFATTTLVFSGFAPASSTVEALYLKSFTTTIATTTTNTDGTWSMELFFDVGTTTISFTAILDTNARSSSTEVTLNAILDTETDDEPQSDSLPVAPLVFSPVSGAMSTSTSILFSGTASSTDIISTDFNSATTTADALGLWTLALDDFSEGTTKISFFATDTTGSTSTATTTSIFVDSIAPSMADFAVSECSYTISADKGICLIPMLTLNALWSSQTDDVEYYELDLNGVVSTTTATSTQIKLSSGDITGQNNNLNYSISVTAVDYAGNQSTTLTELVEITLSPIVINEIAWAGTKGSQSDEWIELANTTTHQISLANMSLFSDDGSPTFEFTDTDIINQNGYYLIERKNSGDSDESTESPIIDVVADKWTSFSFGLKNSGELLTLSYLSDASSTPITLDMTPVVSDCSGWCGGEDAPDYVSMERIDKYASGADKDNWKSNNMTTRNGTDVGSNAINGTPRAENSPLLQCSDGIDNDGDGLVDSDDLGCESVSDDDETNLPVPQCSDGLDNDGDTLIDSDDPGCFSALDDDEDDSAPRCNRNGICERPRGETGLNCSADCFRVREF